MKTFILTADYELFLGGNTGTAEKCMVQPLYKLSGLLDINDSKMTVFWDILHYYRLIELGTTYPELSNDRLLIEKQISYLISKGHDIQLHLHPHWLEAEYKGNEWKFKYDRFDIHALSEEENPDNIYTILGCITKSKQLMEKVIRQYKPGYKVEIFRAGGYLIEPFIKLKKALKFNNIYIDSSVLPGMSEKNSYFFYNFRNYPQENYYRFRNSPSDISAEGRFIEIPVATLRIPVIRNIIFTLIRSLKYRNLEKGRMGTGSAETMNNSKKSMVKKIITLLTKPKMALLTTDGNFAERFNYMYRKAGDNSTMILHPKLLNSHTLNILKEKLQNNDLKFISIKDFLNDRK